MTTPSAARGDAYPDVASDVARVSGILRDAQRGPRDPDLELFKKLVAAERRDVNVTDLLTDLVRDES
jgi:hypothetical protein